MDADEKFYLAATTEFESGSLDSAKWAKILTLADGNERKAKFRYIQERAKELINEAKVAGEESINQQREIESWLAKVKSIAGNHDSIVRELAQLNVYADQQPNGRWNVRHPDGTVWQASNDAAFHQHAQRLFERRAKGEPLQGEDQESLDRAGVRWGRTIFWGLFIVWALTKAVKYLSI
jgi:hypothetical protein